MKLYRAAAYLVILHFPDSSQIDCMTDGPESVFVTGFQTDAFVTECQPDVIFKDGFETNPL